MRILGFLTVTLMLASFGCVPRAKTGTAAAVKEVGERVVVDWCDMETLAMNVTRAMIQEGRTPEGSAKIVEMLTNVDPPFVVDGRGKNVPVALAICRYRFEEGMERLYSRPKVSLTTFLNNRQEADRLLAEPVFDAVDTFSRNFGGQRLDVYPAGKFYLSVLGELALEAKSQWVKAKARAILGEWTEQNQEQWNEQIQEK